MGSFVCCGRELGRVVSSGRAEMLQEVYLLNCQNRLSAL